jgi:hypothetical protein
MRSEHNQSDGKVEMLHPMQPRAGGVQHAHAHRVRDEGETRASAIAEAVRDEGETRASAIAEGGKRASAIRRFEASEHSVKREISGQDESGGEVEKKVRYSSAPRN